MMKNYLKILFCLTLFASVFQVSIYGQDSKIQENPVLKQRTDGYETGVVTLQLNSKLLAREISYRVISPSDYKIQKTKRYSTVYLLHGLTGHFDNWTDRTKLIEYAALYNYIFITPEGNDGWYTDSGSVRDDKYESYIVQELIPEIDKRFRTVADKNHRVIAGLSMGGYGSLKFGLKYPDKFILVGSFSGALQAASLTEKMVSTTGWKALVDSIVGVYGADDSPTRKANDIFKIVREMPADNLKTLPFMYISCGTEDGLIVTNREFTALISEKKIPHEFRELPGIHDWKFWDAQVQEFLRTSERFVK